MQAKRRTLILAATVATLAGCSAVPPRPGESPALYGVIGKIKTKPGQRDALAAMLLQATRAMPGCLSYIAGNDPKDPDALWITEVWDSAASHKASLGLPEVKAALAAGRPLIAGFGERFETTPLAAFVQRSH